MSRAYPPNLIVLLLVAAGLGVLAAWRLTQPGLCPLPDCERIDIRIYLVEPLASVLTTLIWARGRRRGNPREIMFWVGSAGWGAVNALIAGALWVVTLFWTNTGPADARTVLIATVVTVFGAPLLGLVAWLIPIGSALAVGILNALLPARAARADE